MIRVYPNINAENDPSPPEYPREIKINVWMKCDSRKGLGQSFKPADVLSSAV